MPFRPVHPEKLASAVVRQIEELILRGILRPGERLPAERELSERLGVSRPSLREAVADLQARGLLTARAGAGIFVTEALGSAFSDTLVQLFSRHDEAVFDYPAEALTMIWLSCPAAIAVTKLTPSSESSMGLLIKSSFVLRSEEHTSELQSR